MIHERHVQKFDDARRLTTIQSDDTLPDPDHIGRTPPRRASGRPTACLKSDPESSRQLSRSFEISLPIPKTLKFRKNYVRFPNGKTLKNFVFDLRTSLNERPQRENVVKRCICVQAVIEFWPCERGVIECPNFLLAAGMER